MGMMSRDVKLILWFIHAEVEPLSWAAYDFAQASVAKLADSLIPLVEQRTGEPAKRSALLRALYRLKERQVITYDTAQQQWRLTDQGVRRVRTYLLEDLVLPDSPPTWDGQWRVVAFDVPEQSNYLRTIFRRKLTWLGFAYLQRSLWLYPYPCEAAITELAHRLGLEEDIVVLVTSTLSVEKKFLKRFKLHRVTA